MEWCLLFLIIVVGISTMAHILSVSAEIHKLKQTVKSLKREQSKHQPRRVAYGQRVTLYMEKDGAKAKVDATILPKNR